MTFRAWLQRANRRGLLALGNAATRIAVPDQTRLAMDEDDGRNEKTTRSLSCGRPAIEAPGLFDVAIYGTLVVIVVLSMLATPRRTGDAHQYVAMARQFASARGPALSDQELKKFQLWLELHPAATGFPDGVGAMRQPTLVREGQHVLSHFWFYPMLAAPFIAIGDTVGAHPLTGFVLVNSVMLVAAIVVTRRTFGVMAALMMLATPIVWFVGRAQVEVFTFTFLALAMAATATGRWGIASILVAIASTQNLPIAAIIPLIWLGGLNEWMQSRRARHESARPTLPDARRVLGLAIASVAIALIHPLYYLNTLGVVTPQLLNGGIAGTMPTTTRILAPLLDPGIGFVPWLPALTAVWLAGVGVTIHGFRGSRTQSPRTLALVAGSIVCGFWFLFVFAQSTNVNSGGTVHISRYVIWLLPLTLPAIGVAFAAMPRWPARATAPAAFTLIALYLGYFWPDQPERYVVHSPQSIWLMSHLPGLYHPLPEIFVERTLHIDGGPRASAADPDCRLLFIVPDQPVRSCTLTPAEQSEVSNLQAMGARAVWVRRGPDGGADVSAAL